MKKLVLLLAFAVSAGAQTPQYLPKSGGTLTGPLIGTTSAFQSTNGIQHAETFAGATASDKINACLAAAANGVCDARGFGAITQTLAATVEVGVSGASQQLILNPATVFVPSSSSMPAVMFKIDRNGQLSGANVVMPSTYVYTGIVFDVEDTIGGTNTFNLHDISADGTQEVSQGAGGGTCLYMRPPSGSYIQLAHFTNINCSGLKYGLYMTTHATANEYINGNIFTNVMLQGQISSLTMWALTGSLQMNGNTFANIQIDDTVGTGITFPAGAQVFNNTFTSLKIFDAPVSVSNLNTSCTATSGACQNTFIGSIDVNVTDPLADISAWPNQNNYYVTGGVTTCTLCGFNVVPSVDFKLLTIGHGYLGPVSGQGIADDASLGGWNLSTGASSAFGYRFWKGAPGTTLLGQLDASGTWSSTALKVAAGAAMAANHGTGTSVQHSDGTGTSHVAAFDASGSTTDGGTGTANQAVCWKTSGTLGYCSTVVGAGGACTCN